MIEEAQERSWTPAGSAERSEGNSKQVGEAAGQGAEGHR